MGKMDEAKTCFGAVRGAGETDGSGTAARAALRGGSDRWRLKKQAPPFEVTAMDGTRFNLDAMGGRVVLIDFWATWCGPCNEALPEVKKIAKDFAGRAAGDHQRELG